MMTSSIASMFIQMAADDYENSRDAEYDTCRDNKYRFFLIREHADWLYEMYQVIRIWD